MHHKILKWLKRGSKNVFSSIAFLPAIIALLFFGLSVAMIQFDFSDAGKNIKSNLHWISLKDASTARSICTAIAGGVISLAVFSFSMVMILLSQAAAQMSNRILSKLISNRFQQVVLGFYIGTIVYALSLLSTIRNVNAGIHVPAISTYLLIALTILDIFLFIYFLHYITNSVKFETIIHRIYKETAEALEKNTKHLDVSPPILAPADGKPIGAYKSGLFQGFEKDTLLELCREADAVITFLYPVGTYLLKDTPLLLVYHNKELSKNFAEGLRAAIEIGRGQDIPTSYYYGFRQLMEIAIKALSPGINDPGTATIALQALSDLLSNTRKLLPENTFYDKNGTTRIVSKEKTFDDLFSEHVLPIWDYGKNDRLIQKEMLHILGMLSLNGVDNEIGKLIRDVKTSR
jgi:uncharacterized membrane protein